MASAQHLSFGALLKQARRACLTQEALAVRASYSVSYVSQLERGERTPLSPTVELLSAALDLAPADRAALLAAAHSLSHGLARPLARPMSPRPPVVAAGATAPPLVGRARELDALERHLGGEGAPLLVLAGEPGIGKTRLLRETAARAASLGWTVLAGGCQRHSEQEPYAPLLGALLGRVRGRPQAQLRADLEGCAWLARLLPELLDAAVAPAPTWTLSPAQERRLMFAAAGRFLANVAGPAGTLLLLDDLQWAGADALDLLAALLGEAARGGAPLRVVVAYRDTEVHPADPLAMLLADLARADLVARVPLGALTPAEARELVASLLGGAEKSAEDAEAVEKVERVTRRAGGAPFFLVSCALALRDGTLGDEEGGDKERGDEERAVEGSEEVPWSVGQHIRQRVAALPSGAQTLLGAAAVAGRVAPSALLLAMVEQPEAEALAALEAACRAGLLVEDGEAAYRFAHDLIHEVVEAELGAARRRAWHRRAARALEAAAGEPEAERLAEHYWRGGDQEKAVVYLQRAGDQARALYAHAAAEGHYRRLVAALDALGRSLEAARARERLGGVLHTMAHYAAEVEALAQATAAYHAAGDLEGEARTVLSTAYAQSRARTPQEVRALLRPLQEEPLASRLSPHSQALLHVHLGQVHLAEGRLGAALVAHEQALALAQATGADDLLAYAAILGGLTLTDLMRLDEALTLYEGLIAVAERLGDLAMLTRALLNSAACYGLQGRLATSRAMHERAAVVVERLGDAGLNALLTIDQGDLAYVAGDWGEAEAHYAQASAALSRLGPSWAAHDLPISLGRLRLAQGLVEEGLHSLEEGIGLAARSGVVDTANQAQLILAEWDVVEGRLEAACARLEPLLARAEETYTTWALRPVLAWAQLERGEQGRAEELVGQALAAAGAAGVRPILADALCVQALLASRRGRGREAATALEEALASVRAMPSPYAEAKALWIYGQLETARGDPAAARTRFTQALAICDRLGEGLYRPHIEQALGQAGGHADRARASRGRDGRGA